VTTYHPAVIKKKEPLSLTATALINAMSKIPNTAPQLGSNPSPAKVEEVEFYNQLRKDLDTIDTVLGLEQATDKAGLDHYLMHTAALNYSATSQLNAAIPLTRAESFGLRKMPSDPSLPALSHESSVAVAATGSSRSEKPIYIRLRADELLPLSGEPAAPLHTPAIGAFPLSGFEYERGEFSSRHSSRVPASSGAEGTAPPPAPLPWETSLYTPLRPMGRPLEGGALRNSRHVARLLEAWDQTPSTVTVGVTAGVSYDYTRSQYAEQKSSAGRFSVAADTTISSLSERESFLTQMKSLRQRLM